MPKQRERPIYYTDDPVKLANEIEKDLEKNSGQSDYDDHVADTTFYMGEMRLIVKALRLCQQQRETKP